MPCVPLWIKAVCFTLQFRIPTFTRWFLAQNLKFFENQNTLRFHYTYWAPSILLRSTHYASDGGTIVASFRRPIVPPYHIRDCPILVQKLLKKIVHCFLQDLKVRKNAFEIFWPLTVTGLGGPESWVRWLVWSSFFTIWF